MSRLTSIVALPLAALVLTGAVAVAGSACGGGSVAATDDGGGDANANADASTTADASGASDASREAGDSGKLGRVPAVHRAAPVECSHDRGAGNFDPTLMFAPCKSDAECTTGTNGRCLSSMGGAQTNTCSYDTCFTDTECSGKVCTCRDPGSSAANRCSAGNCTVDATCVAGGYCSPSVDPDKVNYPIAGWWCHTAADTCTDDADCASAASPQAKCAYDPAAAHWSCSDKGFYPP